MRRRKLPPPASARVYELTDWGLQLEPTVISLGRWAASSQSATNDLPVISPDSVILATRGLFNSSAAHGLRATYLIRMGEDSFQIQVADDQIHVGRGDPDDADATIDTDPDTLNAVLLNGQPLSDAQRSGRMTVHGDKAAVRRLLRLFPIPKSAPPLSAT